jgi:hypothetical protein
MIFNVELVIKSGVSDSEIITLLTIKNKGYEYLAIRTDQLNSLKDKEFVEMVKGKVGTPTYMNARLSKKGKDFLRDISIPGVSEEAKQVLTNACSSYESRGFGEKIGNKKRAVSLISWFLIETSFSAEQVCKAISDYIWGVGELTYCTLLPNLIWKPMSVFETKPNTADSKLYKLMTQK